MVKRKSSQREPEYTPNTPKPIGYVIVGGVVRGIFSEEDIVRISGDRSEAESDLTRELQDMIQEREYESTRR